MAGLPPVSPTPRHRAATGPTCGRPRRPGTAAAQPAAPAYWLASSLLSGVTATRRPPASWLGRSDFEQEGRTLPQRRWTRYAGLALAIGLVTIAASGCSWTDMPRFGWPSGITVQAHRMLHLWIVACIAALCVGALVWGLIFWTVTFHRKRDDRFPRQTKYNLPLELLYTGLPAIGVVILFVFTATTENFVNKEIPHPPVTVTAVAFQWNWEFQYNDATSPVTHQVTNSIGSSTDIPILVLPVGRVVQVNERSRDVVHSFWVPELLFKRDVIPGLHNSFQFTLTRKGSFVGHCAELCGIYHSAMNFELRSVSPADYQTYVKVLGQNGDNPDRQALALAAIHEPTHAVTTRPLPEAQAGEGGG